MRNQSATTPPCPPPGIAPTVKGVASTDTPDRPAVWSEVRNILYPALRQLGLAQEAATTAAERGADAALVEARLVTLAEAQRWGRPFIGGPAGADTSEGQS